MSRALNRKALAPALLVAGLLLAVAVWPARDGAEAAAAEPRTVHTLVVPSAAFTPTEDGYDYSKGSYVLVNGGGTADFHAAVVFPYPTVLVKRVIFYARDNGTADYRVTLNRNTAAAITSVVMASVRSTGASSVFRSFSTTEVNPRKIVDAFHSAEVTLSAPAGPVSSYGFFTVVIRYEEG